MQCISLHHANSKITISLCSTRRLIPPSYGTHFLSSAFYSKMALPRLLFAFLSLPIIVVLFACLYSTDSRLSAAYLLVICGTLESRNSVSEGTLVWISPRLQGNHLVLARIFFVWWTNHCLCKVPYKTRTVGQIFIP